MSEISELNISNSSDESVHIGTPRLKEIKSYFGRLKKELDQKMLNFDSNSVVLSRNSRKSFHQSMELGDTFLDGDETWVTCRGHLQSTALEPSLFGANETTNQEFHTAFSTRLGEDFGSPDEMGISLDASTIVISSEDSEDEMKDGGGKKGAGTPAEIPQSPISIFGVHGKTPKNSTKKPTLIRNLFTAKNSPKSVKKPAPICLVSII
jgi:hypothetical protein